MIQIHTLKDKCAPLWKDVIFIFIGFATITYTVLTARFVQTLDGDNCPQTYALFVDVARAIRNGELSLWLPYLWGGVPNIGNFMTEAFYPVNWILCNLFYDPDTTSVSYAIIPCNLIIHYCIYYLGFYFLVKKIGFSKLNAFATSMASTLCCALFYYWKWVVYVDGFCYLPLIILFALKLYETKNKLFYSIILAILFAIEASVSMSLMLVLSVYIFGMLFIAYIVGNARKEIIRNLGYSVLTGIWAILLVAPLLFSTLVFVKNMVRAVPDVGFVGWGVKLPLEEYTKYRYTWPDFRAMIKFTNTNIGVSISVFVLLFCIVSLFNRKRDSKRLYYVSLIGVIICGLASFGIIFPAAFYYIPGINQLREAYMYGILLNLFASIMAAYGFNSVEKIILERKKMTEQFRLLIPCGIILFCLLCYNILSLNITCILFIILAVAPVLLILIKPSRLRQIAFYICTFLFIGLCSRDLFQTINVYMYTEPEAIEQVETTRENTRKLVEYINSLDPSDEYYRMTGWGTIPIIPSNMSSILGYHDTISYLNPTFSSGIDLHLRVPLEQRTQMQNIKYFLVNAEDVQVVEMFDTSPNYIKAGEMDHVYTDYTSTDEGTVYIYQALYNIGDAWIVSDYSWNETDTKEEVLAMVACNAIAVDKTAVINACSLTGVEQQDLNDINNLAAQGTVICKSQSNNSLIYEVDSESSGILVTAELYYPGWWVYVNGEKRTTLEVDGTNRGVIVPSGTSTVEFHFRPPLIRTGIALQLFAIALIALAGISHRRKKQEGIQQKKETEGVLLFDVE